MTNTILQPSPDFGKRLSSMLKVDSRRMFGTPMFWVMAGCALAMPILILVMTTMVGSGTEMEPLPEVLTIDDADIAAANPTVEELTVPDPLESAVIHETSPTGSHVNVGTGSSMGGSLAFTNTWQIIGSESGGDMAAMMDMTAMMNINLIFFMTGIFLCIFVSQDFSSGYAKNLFTVRARKTDYVASKTIMGFIAGAVFLIAFFIGGVLGGSFAGLPFTLGIAGVPGLIMCMVAKIFLMAVFVALALLAGVFAKQKAWLSILLYLFGGMLLFMMIPMMTPLNSGPMNVILCLAGGAIFAAGIGIGSKIVLERTNLV